MVCDVLTKHRHELLVAPDAVNYAHKSSLAGKASQQPILTATGAIKNQWMQRQSSQNERASWMASSGSQYEVSVKLCAHCVSYVSVITSSCVI